jgi:hypothetical protein
MNKKSVLMTVVMVCVLSLLVVGAAEGAVITVRADGTGDYPTIQAAINAAFNGDTVLVADGTYTGNGNRDIDFLGKAITVCSENGPENCIIDCQNSGRGFYFHNLEGPASMLEGFTITNGHVESRGGAIRLLCSSPTIRSCIFYDNSSGINGGALHCGYAGSCGLLSNPTVIDCVFIENTCYSGAGGGAVYGSSTGAEFRNCVFERNSANRCGGAVYGSSATFINCVIKNNTASEQGGGFDFWGNHATLINCTIVGNSAGTYGGGISCGYLSRPTIFNSIIWNNEAVSMPQIYLSGGNLSSSALISYTDVQDGWPGTGNIAVDPLFVNSDDNNYHLLPGSPCIDTGDPNYVAGPNEIDLDGNPRVLNGRIDMGAYEYIPPVEIGVKLTPQMLSCDSHGKWLKAHVTLPEEIYPEDIDVNTPAVANPPGVESEFIEVNEYSDGYFDVQIYFDREIFCQALSESEEGFLEVTVSGLFIDGRKFQGSDTIKLKSKLWQHRIRKDINREKTLELRKTKQ